MGGADGNGGLRVGSADMPAGTWVHSVHVQSNILFGIVEVRRALLVEQLESILLVLGGVVSESSFLLGTIPSDIASVRCIDLADELLLVSEFGCRYLFVFAAALLHFDSSFLVDPRRILCLSLV